MVNREVAIRRSQEMDLKPRVLCEKPCNSEWGSDLEQLVGPILTPMIRGQARTLSGREIQLISAWFFLKVMVSEYLLPSGSRPRQFFELEDGEHLRATLRPPEGSRIWMGRYVGTRATAGWITDRSSAREVSVSPRAGAFWHSVTYSIGQVLLHFFAASRPILLDDAIGDLEEHDPVRYVFRWAPGDWGACLVPIWETPGSPIGWPPQKAFDDKGFVYLANRWNAEQPPRTQPPSQVAKPREPNS
jgi:hypothetical protein